MTFLKPGDLVTSMNRYTGALSVSLDGKFLASSALFNIERGEVCLVLKWMEEYSNYLVLFPRSNKMALFSADNLCLVVREEE